MGGAHTRFRNALHYCVFRCSLYFSLLFFYSRKWAVPTPASETLFIIAFFGARCTFLCFSSILASGPCSHPLPKRSSLLRFSVLAVRFFAFLLFSQVGRAHIRFPNALHYCVFRCSLYDFLTFPHLCKLSVPTPSCEPLSIHLPSIKRIPRISPGDSCFWGKDYFAAASSTGAGSYQEASAAYSPAFTALPS